MKLITNKLFLLPFTFILFMSFNTHAQHYYLVTEGDLLMIAEKDDIKFSTVFPGEGLYSTQLGYSPIKHLSVTGSFLYDKTSNQNYGNFGTYDRISKGFNTNIAIGGYLFLSSKKSESDRFFLSKNVTMDQGFLFDLYGGYNYGKIHNYYEGTSASHFDTNKFYAQLGAHWVFRIGTLSYALRAVHLSYSNGKAQGELQENELRDLFEGGIQDHSPVTFYESSFRYQIGIRQVRIYTGVTTKHQKDNIRPNEAKRVVITAGLIFELDEIFKKREEVPVED
ncbi:MAG: hypothetical protein ACI8VT_001324 [Saprospiraceae bacterium]|jgi:hypothetical protein